MDIKELLTYTVAQNASDLHLSTGMMPLVRIDGDLFPVPNTSLLEENSIINMLHAILPPEVDTQLGNNLDIDSAISVTGVEARFRVNIFYQIRGISVAFRTIPLKIPTIADLSLPEIFYQLCDIPHGLILITGPTGSGKSTTLAAMIDHINTTQKSHILTIEDPIEYLHECKSCLLQQREVAKHTKTFDGALRSALREDPDYILVGEMRDLETVRLALTAAETGHLVLTTLHTNSAPGSVDRIVDVFPSHEKTLIRAMLANSLKAVACQMLVRKIGGGRMAAHEMMLCTPAISNMIRENKIQQLSSAIQTSQEKGMHTLSQNLQQLALNNLIDTEEYKDLLYVNV